MKEAVEHAEPDINLELKASIPSQSRIKSLLSMDVMSFEQLG